MDTQLKKLYRDQICFEVVKRLQMCEKEHMKKYKREKNNKEYENIFEKYECDKYLDLKI